MASEAAVASQQEIAADRSGAAIHPLQINAARVIVGGQRQHLVGITIESNHLAHMNRHREVALRRYPAGHEFGGGEFGGGLSLLAHGRFLTHRGSGVWHGGFVIGRLARATREHQRENGDRQNAAHASAFQSSISLTISQKIPLLAGGPSGMGVMWKVEKRNST